jgi:hypothetical protein
MQLTRIFLALMFTYALAACETSPMSGTGGGGSSGSTTATGGAVVCAPSLQDSPVGCPGTTEAETAFASMKSMCGLIEGDLDTSNPESPDLTAAGKAKLCVSCACEQKAFNYYAVYANCTEGSDAANAALAANIHVDAAACQPAVCAPTLQDSPATCPGTTEAEMAYSSMKSACGLNKGDLDTSNPDSPDLTASAKAKLCVSCLCEQAAFDYYAEYVNCTDGSDAANAALAANIHIAAAACQK